VVSGNKHKVIIEMGTDANSHSPGGEMNLP